MKTLLIDGEWNLKRNYFRNKKIMMDTGKDNTVFGFIESLRAAITKVLPDRVVIMWDGYRSGKYRYEFYKPYKANRNKVWEDDDVAIATDGQQSEEDRDKFQILRDKIQVKNYLEDLFVRQLEREYIEADDLIAYYVIKRQKDEQIIIYSRDKDYLQLIDEDISILTPDSQVIITHENFKELKGYCLDNTLMFKCFDGDKSDNILGVKGVTTEGLLKLFPGMENHKYTMSQLISEANKMLEKKKSKYLEKIVESSNIVYRNATLMNLKKPFIDEASRAEVEKIISLPISIHDRNIQDATKKFIADGFTRLLYREDIGSFFAPFYRISQKEKNFNKNIL